MLGIIKKFFPEKEPELKTDFRTTQFFEIGNKFEACNKSRLDFLRNNLSREKRDVFDLIPVILHENDPALPGGDITGKPLHGISCFSISTHQKNLLAKYFPGFNFRSIAKPSLPIEFLAVIGSAGTLAFTGQSDIDYWVGVEVEKQNSYAMDLLMEKFMGIEKWALNTTGMEIHFFVADQNKIRCNDYGETGGESCGSALGKLLKDEFYRTAIILQGKMPYFWLMPPGINDEEYSSHIQTLINTESFPYTKYVDLDNIGFISRAEYFGAALWQILKGLNSPFKSVLKIGLLDKYTYEHEKTLPLCEQYKEILLANPLESRPDPYLFMVEAVRLYYSDQNNLEVRKLLEKCFFIKSLLKSGSVHGITPKNMNTFYEIGSNWGWQKEEILDCADFSRWYFEKREALRRQIVGFLTNTYKAIHKRTKETNIHISEKDLTIIGRQLSCFFEQKAGKIPYEICFLEAKDISGLSIEESRGLGRNPYWEIKATIKGTKSSQLHVIKRLNNPLISIFWCCLNRLYKYSHDFHFKGTVKWSATEVLHLLRTVNEFFPATEIGNLSAGQVLGKPRITHLFILPNWEKPNWKFGIASVFAFFLNTRGEMLYALYKGEDCPKWIAEDILLKRTGRDNLKSLQWTVHTPKGPITTGKKIGANLSQFVQKFIEAATPR